MICFRKVFVLVFLVKTFGFSEEWIPVSSPQIFQNYMRHIKIMKQPETPQYYQILPVVDFGKPKTQTFYKASLLQQQPPVYEFRYKIHDPKEENYQEKSEVRTGDSVKGYYTVREPNGYIRLVRYISDENGFQTQVSHHYAGENEGGRALGLKQYYT